MHELFMGRKRTANYLEVSVADGRIVIATDTYLVRTVHTGGSVNFSKLFHYYWTIRLNYSESSIL